MYYIYIYTNSLHYIWCIDKRVLIEIFSREYRMVFLDVWINNFLECPASRLVLALRAVLVEALFISKFRLVSAYGR